MQAWYSIFVGVWGYAPSEFWRLSPGELWWILEMKLPEKPQELSESDWDELYNLLG